MTAREHYIKNIIENMHTVKRGMFSCPPPHKAGGLVPHSQWMVLRVVKEKGGASVKDIAETLGVSSSAATQLINALVKKNMLVRTEGAKDRRTLIVALSPEYEKHAREMESHIIKNFTEMFSALTEEELAQCAYLIKKIAATTTSHRP